MEDAPFDPKCQNVLLKITREKEMSEFCFILFFFSQSFDFVRNHNE